VAEGNERAVRQGRFKLHFDILSGEVRLFDLEKDPLELSPMAPEAVPESDAERQRATAAPSTSSEAPETKEARSEHSQTAASAISSEVPSRPPGWLARIMRSAAGSCMKARSMGVSTLPGQIAFTRTPLRAFSTAAVRVRPRIACFEAQ
jgi:hypothetical protein